MAERSRLRVRRTWVWPAVLCSAVIVVLAAGAAAAVEVDTVHTFWRGLWWSISLVTTVGFVGEVPRTGAGAVLSVFLMVIGFLLLAMVSAAFAAIFVRDEERPRDAREEEAEHATLRALERLEARLVTIERRLEERSTD
ncbi:MAG: potassium channel family protein [Actinomycetes bacterium]